MAKRWPIEAIVAAIQDRHARGLSLGRKALLLEDRSLLTAIEYRQATRRPHHEFG